jgi:periplasmic divalent cation tolerance protein
MSDEVRIVLTMWPDLETARRASRLLVEEQLAACANILPGVESIYRWQGVVETASEVMVLFKTTGSAYPEFARRVQALHSYEVPEIIAISAVNGLATYLQWVADSCGSGTGSKEPRKDTDLHG